MLLNKRLHAGVLFGLKVVMMTSSKTWEYVTLPMVGIPVKLPPKVVAWTELLFIKYMVPGSSFTWHLCGMLAGVCVTAVVISLPLSAYHNNASRHV
jgi:hypothetical protein